LPEGIVDSLIIFPLVRVGCIVHPDFEILRA
jgi:hypothetical protein